ncbi:MAG: hypothetical protein H7301_02815 [Cryobacterium sp.]|nr:hypothetical protein [Oligoflexia bacterium]
MVKHPAAILLGTLLFLGTVFAVIRGNLFRGDASGSGPAPASTNITKSAGKDSNHPGSAERVRRYCANPYEVTCENPTRTTTDPTGRVDLQISGEVRALRVLRKILTSHADWNSKQVEDQLVTEIYTEKRVKRIESAYRWVKAQLHTVIERQDASVFSVEEKQAILSRVDRVELNLPPPASNYADAADVFTKNSIYYERTETGQMRLRVGGAYLLNISSWYNLVFSLAHEFSHAIDPCEMAADAVVPTAYRELISCFVRTGWVDGARNTCGDNEQVSEVFADWMAAEVVSSSLGNSEKDYSGEQRVQAAVNSVRDLCEEAVSLDVLSTQNHQTPAIRIGKMFGRNPLVRKSMGCENTPAGDYCAFSPRK